MSRVDVGQVTNMNDIEALEERVTSVETNLDSEIDTREEQITELKNDLNLKITRNLLDISNPNLHNNVDINADVDKVTLTAKTNATFLNALYVIDTHDIDYLTISYKSYSGTGSGNIRLGYNASGDATDAITWVSYLNGVNPRTFVVTNYDYVIVALYAVQSENKGVGHYITYEEVQIESGKTATEYIRHYVPCDTVARENISEIKSDVNDLYNTQKKIESAKNPVTMVSAPNGFRWSDNPLTEKITNDYKGNVYLDFDIAEYDPTTADGTYFVDPVNGLSSNDGKTRETALNSISTAFGKDDVTCIYLVGGVYNATKNLYATQISKTIAIKGIAGENVIIAQTSDTTFITDAEHVGIYYGNRGNCYGIVDLNYRNADGDGVQYSNTADVNEVYATPGSWTLTNGVIYVHTLDGRTPDNKLLLFRSGDNLHVVGNITLYLENIKVYGGNSPLIAENVAGSGELKVFAKDCEFYYSYTENNDAIMMQGATLTVFERCKAKYAMKDGFNYHAKNSVIPKAIEINCIGAFNGNDVDSNDQGSTIHDAGSIIRINGIYHDNYGGNLADQGTDTEAWMIGCVAYASKAPNSGQNANYFTYDDVHHWLDSCVGFGSVSNLYKHNDDSIVALRNCRMDGKLIPSGQEVEYY